MIPTHNTWAAAGLLVLEAAQNPLRVACVREVQKSIKESSKYAIEGWIHRMGLTGQFQITRDWIRGHNGSYFFFRGMSTSTQEAIRGLEDVDRVWVEEAQRLSARSREILYPTLRKETSQIWMTFNPKHRSDPVYQEFVVNQRPDSISRLVNFDQNPWFPQVLDEERLHCMENEPNRYPHIWLGQTDDEGESRVVMPYSTVKRCVDAHRTIGYNPSGRVHAGLDVADTGADKSAVVCRRGPLIESALAWSAQSLGSTTRRVHNICVRDSASRLYYDVTGIGSGVRSHLRDLRDAGRLPYMPEPIRFGGKVAGEKTPFQRGVTNRDHFGNRGAQLAWNLHLRARRTIRLLEGDSNINPEHCLFISRDIPKLDAFLTQLAQPLWDENASGKVIIDKAPESAPSPDMYDAAVLAFSSDSRYGLRSR